MSAVRADAIPPSVPADTIKQLDEVVGHLDREQLIWTSGYLAGLAAGRAAAANAVQPAPQQRELPASPWTIFYATETGNSRRVAQSVEERLRQIGVGTELVDLRDFDPKAL